MLDVPTHQPNRIGIAGNPVPALVFPGRPVSVDTAASHLQIALGLPSAGDTMAVHTLHTSQTIRATAAQAWDFFSNPRNLARITPPKLGFEIITPDLPERIHPGLMIAYRVRPLLGFPMTWLTEITHVDEGSRFVDEQRVGPYAVWHHEHTFHDRGDGRIELVDRVTYVLPFGPLGHLVHGWLVRPQLHRIFAFRDDAVRNLFCT